MLRRATVWVVPIDDPDRGLPVRSRSSAEAGISMPGSAPISIWPVTVEPSRISAGGSDQPDLDLEGAGDRIGLRRHLAHAADRLDVAV